MPLDRSRIPASLFNHRESRPTGRPDTAMEEAKFNFPENVPRLPDLHINLSVAIRPSARNYFRLIAERLCGDYPEISTDPKIFGGNPHLKNIRLTVSNVLAKLYVYGSTKAVADMYAPHVSEEQIKEAIAYAQDFLEAAAHSHETP